MTHSDRDAVIVANGILTDAEQLRSLVAAADIVIAADGGGAHLRALGLRPHWLIGDFDSLDATMLADFLALGARVERHPPAKDATDLELALQLAQRLGATRIRIVAGLGGRHDQALANLLLLAESSLAGLDLALLDGAQTLRVLRGPSALTIAGTPGDTLSILPIGGDAVGVTLEGLAYPLRAARLPLGTSRGISNVLAGTTARIVLETGALVVVHTALSVAGSTSRSIEVSGGI
ncbi:MAG: thiamine diphosphokinase [Anaerolineales bacterium]|nr:thiamine diphosphokinase [Anaerolineales bacterium]